VGNHGKRWEKDGRNVCRTEVQLFTRGGKRRDAKLAKALCQKKKELPAQKTEREFSGRVSRNQKRAIMTAAFEERGKDPEKRSIEEADLSPKKREKA